MILSPNGLLGVSGSRDLRQRAVLQVRLTFYSGRRCVWSVLVTLLSTWSLRLSMKGTVRGKCWMKLVVVLVWLCVGLRDSRVSVSGLRLAVKHRKLRVVRNTWNSVIDRLGTL